MNSTPAAPSPRNPWPGAILAAFALFIAGTAVLVVLACSNGMDLVSRDYYEQEIRFQGQIDRRERARRLQPPASVAYDADRGEIRLSLPPRHAREARGRIHLYRPSAARQDRRLELALQADGSQVLDAKSLPRGSWKVQVSWTVGGEEYYLDQSLRIGS